VTFLFTDIEGSTRLWEQHPDEMRLALEAHDALVRDPVEKADGFVFATGGDGFCVAFQRAHSALEVVLAVRTALQEFSWPKAVTLKVRMALHTGEAIERDGDYFGPSVNRAARLLTVAGGDQIVVSAATASLLSDGVPPGVRLIDAGTYTLRGLERPDHVFQLLPPGADVVPLSAPAVTGNLPGSLTTYVGQSTEMKRLADDLPRRRLITLTGVGGVGKTRMALEAAWAAHDEFSGGVWLVELAPITEPDGVTHAVASVLRVEPYPGLALEDAIIDALQGRRLLLIVDNCEHVIEAANRLIGRIVSSCPTVTVLATSREPLGVVGERVVGVRSLDPELEAVELFCERAEAADSDFSPSPTDLEAIGRVCRRLDGIPLALELAAARTRTMSLVELERRLSDRFRLLRGAGRGRVERHQTLRATVAWSHQLLSPSERAVFDRCAVFAGSFDERAVEAVCTDDAMDLADVVDVVSALVDKSMLVADRREGETRYRLLETLRQYAEEQLGPQLHTFRARQLAHYVAVADELDRRFQGSDLSGGNAAFHVELDNLRAAMQWAIATRDPTAMALMRATTTFALVAPVPEIAGWFAQLLVALDDPPAYAYGQAALTSLTFEADNHGARTLAQAGIDTAASPDDPDLADCWSTLAFITLTSPPDARPDAAALFEHAFALYRAAGNPIHAVNMATVLTDIVDGQPAQEWARTARRLANGLTSQLANIYAAFADGIAATKRGDAAHSVAALRVTYDQIVAADIRGWVKSPVLWKLAVALADGPATANNDAFLAGSFRRMQSDGHKWAIAHDLWALAIYLAATSRPEPAGVVVGFLEHAGVPPMDPAAGRRATDAIGTQPQHGEWRARGRRLSQDEVFAVALAALDHHDQ
jgi:predicted ATPase/class 3 adenylate cyclase